MIHSAPGLTSRAATAVSELANSPACRPLVFEWGGSGSPGKIQSTIESGHGTAPIRWQGSRYQYSRSAGAFRVSRIPLPGRVSRARPIVYRRKPAFIIVGARLNEAAGPPRQLRLTVKRNDRTCGADLTPGLSYHEVTGWRVSFSVSGDGRLTIAVSAYSLF